MSPARPPTSGDHACRQRHLDVTNNACSSRKQGERFVRWDTTTCAAAGREQQVTHIHFWSFDQVPLCAHDYWGIWKNNNCRAYTVILLMRNDSDRSFSFNPMTGTSNYLLTIIYLPHITGGTAVVTYRRRMKNTVIKVGLRRSARNG